jgi:hypothetical protein
MIITQRVKIVNGMRVKYSKVPLALSLVFTVSFGWYAVKSVQTLTLTLYADYGGVNRPPLREDRSPLTIHL